MAPLARQPRDPRNTMVEFVPETPNGGGSERGTLRGHDSDSSTPRAMAGTLPRSSAPVAHCQLLVGNNREAASGTKDQACGRRTLTDSA